MFHKIIYIASRENMLEDKDRFDENGNEVVNYKLPIKYEFNVQPLNGSLDLQQFGERINLMQRAVIPYDTYFGKFKEGDLAYLDGLTPNYEEFNGTDANYKIYSVMNQNKVIVILFERLIGR